MSVRAEHGEAAKGFKERSAPWKVPLHYSASLFQRRSSVPAGILILAELLEKNAGLFLQPFELQAIRIQLLTEVGVCASKLLSDKTKGLLAGLRATSFSYAHDLS